MSTQMASAPESEGARAGGQNGSKRLSQDDIFDLLSNSRRRYALHYLLQEEDPPTLRDLSRQVAAWENDTAIEDITSKQRRRVYIALHQTHLPTMDDAGVVNYDTSANVVELSDNADELQVYLDVVEGNEIPWNEFYLGLGLTSCALVASIGIGTYPFTLVPGIVWAGIIALAFTVAGIVHTYHARDQQLGSEGKPPTLR